MPAEGRRETVPVLGQPRHALSGRGAVGGALQVGQPQERLVKLVLRGNNTQHTPAAVSYTGRGQQSSDGPDGRSEVPGVTGQGAYLGGQVGEGTVERDEHGDLD